MAIHSSTLAWKIPWTEEPDRLQSMGSQRVEHDWVTSLSLCCLDEASCMGCYWWLGDVRSCIPVVSFVWVLTIWYSLGLVSEKAMAPHSSTLAWKSPWTEEPGRLQSMGLLRWSRRRSRSVVSDSLRPRGLYSQWDFPGQNTGVVSCSLLQEIFPTQGSNPGLLHCRQILYRWGTRDSHE